MGSLLSLFKPAPYQPEMEDAVKIKADYNYWRMRIFYSMYAGYAIYYFTRKSFTFASPSIMAEFNLTKGDIGWIGSVLAISYGFSKFVSGIISDYSNPRYFMSIGLIMTGVLNIIFGMSSAFWAFAVIWALNGWFQGFGWPPCAKLLTYWYSQSERGRWWGAWNTCHNLGGALIPVVVAFCAEHYGWRSAMYLPGLIAIVVGFWLMNRLRDTPRSLGLPIVEKFRNDYVGTTKEPESENISVKEVLLHYILPNKFIWLLALAYLLVYIVRTAINDWTMLYLLEAKGYESKTLAGQSILFFEAGGILGSLFAGWFSDKVFGGRRGHVNFFFGIGLLLSLSSMYFIQYNSMFIDYAVIFLIGFFVFGPQMLIGIAAVELSHKKAAATATGLVGWIAYLGAATAGGPLGTLMNTYGWDGFFITMLVCTVLAAILLFPLIWATPYRRKTSSA